MARTQTPTLIPLDRVAHHLQIDPYHFNSIFTHQRPLRASCDDGWYQYSWQASGKISREELASALKQAEETVITYLGWSFLPRWYEDEHNLPRHYKPEVSSNSAINGQPRSVISRWGYVIEAGTRVSDFVAQVPVTFSDEDHDGYEETVTISFATTVTDKEELRVYYPDKSGKDYWEIRPLSFIEIDDTGVATIRFPRYMIARDDLLEHAPAPDDPHIALDGDTEENFLEYVDVYRVYTDPTRQVEFHYGPLSNCYTPGCQGSTSSGCVYIKNSRMGIMQYVPGSWNEGGFAPGCYLGEPSKAKFYYKAGWVDNSLDYPSWQQVDSNLERRIVFYAASLLDRELCGCSNTRNIWQYQTEDMAKITPERSYTFPWDLVGNPLGTSRAAMQLWKYIQPLRLSQSSHKR